MTLVVKNQLANVGDFREGFDPLEKEMATCFSIRAWKIPWTEEPSRLQSIGLQRVGHECSLTHSLTFSLVYNSSFICEFFLILSFSLITTEVSK